MQHKVSHEKEDMPSELTFMQLVFELRLIAHKVDVWTFIQHERIRTIERVATCKKGSRPINYTLDFHLLGSCSNPNHRSQSTKCEQIQGRQSRYWDQPALPNSSQAFISLD